MVSVPVPVSNPSENILEIKSCIMEYNVIDLTEHSWDFQGTPRIFQEQSSEFL